VAGSSQRKLKRGHNLIGTRVETRGSGMIRLVPRELKKMRRTPSVEVGKDPLAILPSTELSAMRR